MIRLLIILFSVSYFCSATKYCESPPRFVLDENTKMTDGRYRMGFIDEKPLAVPGGSITFECLSGFKFQQTGGTKMIYECKDKKRIEQTANKHQEAIFNIS
ncbi:hypothetical protein SNEBB_007111 [Seison nebaliae]|nr:hypothetical protein SNEBB_007111 [Seison nebaliae]